MPPPTSLSAWWTTHLQLPGYDPIATAGSCHLDMRAAEQAVVFCTQVLRRPMSAWEEAIILNLWGWRQANGQRRYVTVYAEPYRHDALALWCAAFALWLLRAAPVRRAPQVTVAYARAALAAEAYALIAAASGHDAVWGGAVRLDPERQTVGTPGGGLLTSLYDTELVSGEVLVQRTGGPPMTLAVATRDAEHSATVAPLAEAAQQALAGQAATVLPALL